MRISELLQENLNEFAPGNGDDREPNEEEILRKLAAQWWSGTEQQMARAQQTLETLGWEIGPDESGDEDAGVYVYRIGDDDGRDTISFGHSELSLDEGNDPYEPEAHDEFASDTYSDDEQGVAEGSLNEFAPANNPGGGNYLKALASAWYNGTFNTGDLHKGIKSQEDVERILERGIHCGDGKVRKYSIGYNSDFDGVEIQSDDHYEYSDYDDAGNDIDSRTGKPWGPYDVVAFHDSDLDESISKGNKKPEQPEADYGDDYQAMVSRVKKLAGLGPLKTVYDPQKRVYKNVPTAEQPKK